MLSRSNLHNSVVFGLSAAIIAGVVSKMPINLHSWQSPHSELQNAHNTSTNRNPLINECNCSQHEVNWHDVLQFLGMEVAKVDPQWAVLAASLLLMLIHRLRHDFAPRLQNKSIGLDSDVKSELTNEGVDCPTSPPYELRERALLQFQKNKSEPINFKYGYKDDEDLDDSDVDENSIAEVIRRYSLRNRTPSVKGASESPSTHIYEVADQENATLSHTSKATSKNDRISGASIISKDEEKSYKVVSKSSNSSLTIHFQPTYPKPNSIQTELNEEQVYSEPFIY